MLCEGQSNINANAGLVSEIRSAATCERPLQILLGSVAWLGKPAHCCPPPTILPPAHHPLQKAPRASQSRRCSEKYPESVGQGQCSFKIKGKTDPQASFTSPSLCTPPSSRRLWTSYSNHAAGPGLEDLGSRRALPPDNRPSPWQQTSC